jgi:hypothetical protein
MGKIIGWVLMILGLIVIVIRAVLDGVTSKIPLLSNFKMWYFFLAGLILIGGGFFISRAKHPEPEEEDGKEVPIYKGNKVVGYRRK